MNVLKEIMRLNSKMIKYHFDKDKIYTLEMEKAEKSRNNRISKQRPPERCTMVIQYRATTVMVCSSEAKKDQSVWSVAQ